MNACWFLNSSFFILSTLGSQAHFYSVLFYFLVEFFFETMKGLHISCPFNENYGESKLFMNFNLGEGEGGNFTPVGFHQIIQKW